MPTAGSRSFFGEVRVAGDMFVGGSMQGGANGINFEAPVTLSSIAPATSVGTGALVIAGGASIYGSTFMGNHSDDN